MARRVGSASVLKSTSWAFGIGTHNPLTIDLTYNRRDMCESSGNVERHHDPRHKAPPTMWGGPSSAGWRHSATTWSQFTIPVGYTSCIFVIDHTWSRRRGDALHIAAICRCLRYATL